MMLFGLSAGEDGWLDSRRLTPIRRHPQKLPNAPPTALAPSAKSPCPVTRAREIATNAPATVLTPAPTNVNGNIIFPPELMVLPPKLFVQPKRTAINEIN